MITKVRTDFYKVKVFFNDGSQHTICMEDWTMLRPLYEEMYWTLIPVA